MLFPNNEGEREEYLAGTLAGNREATENSLDSPLSRLLNADLARRQKQPLRQGRIAGYMLYTIRRFRELSPDRAISIRRANFLATNLQQIYNKETENISPANERYTSHAWSVFQYVAHLWAAFDYRTTYMCLEDRSTTAWDDADVIRFLAAAQNMRQFAEQEVLEGAHKPIFDDQHAWTAPEPLELPDTTLFLRPIVPQELEVYEKYHYKV